MTRVCAASRAMEIQTPISIPKPFDFYSPDTFNYATLEVGACPTLAVTVKAINSYAVNTFPEPNASNPLCQIMHFEIDAGDQSPVIQSAVATPNLLWPPNHKMIPVTLAVAATDELPRPEQKDHLGDD